MLFLFYFLASGNNAKSAQPKKLSVVFNGHVDRIDPSQLVKGEPVGEGSFGTVYKGSCGGIPVVIKSVNILNLYFQFYSVLLTNGEIYYFR